MAQTLSSRSIKVLVVDDDVDLREMLTEALSDHGYRVAIAHDGASALNRLKQEPFDMVVTDMNMPGINGIELLTNIYRARMNVTPILMSSSLNETVRAQAGRLGAYAAIDKPFSCAHLFSLIENSCRQRTKADNHQANVA
ncbi:MAG: response regulator [Deltaproteobacteria bacterium]|nr:response regulator [Deltaproteobacteria bacterium]